MLEAVVEEEEEALLLVVEIGERKGSTEAMVGVVGREAVDGVAG